MKTSLTLRLGSFVLSAFVTLVVVQVIADYAYPDAAPAGAVQLASGR